MPVITVNLKDFCSLVGKELPMSLLRERLPMLGTAWERESPEEFDIEVFPSRPDMFSTEGLARAFSGFIGARIDVPRYTVAESSYRASVDASVKEVRPKIVIAVIEDMNFTDEALKSVMQLQEKLHVSYCRNRKKASIGVYDLDKVRFPLRYTTKDSCFRFIPLDLQEKISIEDIFKKHPKGIEYGHVLTPFGSYPILMDSEETVLSMPPIINSEDTRVTASTRNLVVDVTGLEWLTINMVLNIVTCALAERGGHVKSVALAYPYDTPVGKDVRSPDLSLRRLNLEGKAVQKLLGLNLSIEEVKAYLKTMRFGVEAVDGDTLTILIPPYRADIMHPVDLMEDIAIAYGYDNITPEIPHISTIGGEDLLETLSARVRDLVVGFGYQEVMTYILTNPRLLFTAMRLPEVGAAEIANPETTEYTVCRNWLIPSLITVLSRNKHRDYPQRVFELDDVIELDEASETKARTRRKLAAVTTHTEAGFSEVKSVVDALLKALGVKGSVTPGTHPSFLEGRFGVVAVNSEDVGFLGEIHPEVIINFSLENPIAALEIDLEKLRERLRKPGLSL